MQRYEELKKILALEATLGNAKTVSYANTSTFINLKSKS